MSHTPAVWSRADLAAFADRMLLAVRPYASPAHGRVTLPGAEGGYGHAVDGLEGFARTFLLAGFRLAGEHGEDPLGLAQWYADGIAAGVDPAAAADSPERWVRLPEHGQAKVEAASLALVLDMTRAWIWDGLSPLVQEQVVDYLSPVVGDATYPRNNWVWFRLVVQTFLRSVGGPYDLGEMAEDLATHDSFVRADGWYSDGAERSYDHYVGWAMHLYPTLWARMTGAGDLAAPRAEHDRAMLDRFLTDAVHLVGGDGSPLLEGRSLVYRFAAAAPYWAGAIAQVPSTPLGLLRRAGTSVVQHFAERGDPGDDGLLTMGWRGEWREIAQAYSGPSSPYWASKGLIGLALPADHPVWTAPDEPLPVQVGDTLLAVRAPGWLVAGTAVDGMVRVVNHGTDHADEGAQVADSPLYTRLGYSTATVPPLDERAWREPVDQSVVLVDGEGARSHRAGMRTLAVRVDETAAGPVGYAASVADAHWVDVGPQQVHHGSGYTGRVRPAGRITVHSIVRGPWEVRLVAVDDLAAEARNLVVGGWPLAGADPQGRALGPHAAGAVADGLTSSVVALLGAPTAGLANLPDAGPLGAVTVVPWLAFDARPGTVAVLLTLTGASLGSGTTDPAARLGVSNDGALVDVSWPDGVTTPTRLAENVPGPIASTDR